MILKILKKYKTSIIFLLLAILWYFFAHQYLTKLPKDFSFTSNVVSIDNFFDIDRGEYTGSVFSDTEYSYETIYSDNNLSKIKNVFDVRTPGGDKIFSNEEVYNIDRVTKFNIDNDTYLFAPEYLEKGEGFKYHHINYDAVADMKFIGETYLYGMLVYEYETRYEGQKIDQTELLTHLPGVGDTMGVELDPYLKLWIEPNTGRLIKYYDDTVAYYYSLDTGERLYPWNHFSNTFDESSVKEIVEDVSFWGIKNKIVDKYVPTILLIISIILFLRENKKLHIKIKGLTTIKIVGWLLFLTSSLMTLSIVFINDLVRSIDYFNSLNLLTSICFLLVGLGFIKIQDKKTSLVISAVLISVGVIRTLSIFEVIGFQIDIFLNNYIESLSQDSARMGSFTASSFITLGSVIFLNIFSRIRKMHILEIICSISVIFSILSIIGYLFGNIKFFDIPFFHSVSIYTSSIVLISSLSAYLYFRGKTYKDKLPLVGWVEASALLFVLIFITVMIVWFVDHDSKQKSLNNFDVDSSKIEIAIENRLNVYVNALKGGKGLFESSDIVTRDEWKRYVDSIDVQDNYPGIQGMGYAVFVDPDNLDEHVEEIRDEGFEEYNIKPEGDRDLYSTIIYLEPFDERNIQAFGYDMFSNNIRRSAMEQARDSGEAAMSGKITLVQEIDDDVQSGFLVYVPYYGNGSDINSIESRKENIVGYVYSPFRARDFIEGVIGVDGDEDIGLRIDDAIDGGEGSLIYDDTEGKFDNISGIEMFTKTETIYVVGRPWKFTFTAPSNYEQGIFNRFLPMMVLTAGLVFSILLTSIFYILIFSRHKALIQIEKATKELKVSNARREAILSNIAEGLIVIDKKGKFLLFNNRAKEILGKGPTKKDISEWSKEYGILNPKTEKNIDIQKVLKNKLMKGEIILGSEVLIRNSKVHDIYIKINASPVKVGRSTIGSVVTFIDVSKEKKIDRTKSEFVSIASHQLRTPITSINWHVELLKDSGVKLDKEQKEYLGEIESASTRMTNLINSLLNVSRLDLGSVLINPVKSDIKIVIEKVVTEIKAGFKNKKQKFIVKYDKSIPEVSVDPQILQMIVQNILSNAHKYTPEKGNISLDVKKVKRNRKGYVSIVCKDDGYGIPKIDQKDLFKKLHRADNIKKIGVPGTGLGMYIVKTVVDASGCLISFESEEDKGTTFEILIPLSGMKKVKGDNKLSSFE